MKKILYIIPLLALGAAVSGCGDFLNKYPKDQSYVNNTDDLNELLVGKAYMSPSAGYENGDIGYWMQVMDDDMLFITSSTDRYPACDFYWWEPYVETENTWKALYERINIINAVLDEVDRFIDEPGDNYRKVKGEALFLRSAYYYLLVNLYAQPYSAQTAAGPGVPLKLISTIEDKRYSRNTVGECYDRIVKDLGDAVELLKGIHPDTPYKAGEMSARMLLGRVHLYMGNWEEAAAQCNAVISSPLYRLLNYNAIEYDGVMINMPSVVSKSTPEMIFSAGVTTTGAQAFSITTTMFGYSSELEASYTVDDLRLTYFFRGNPFYGKTLQKRTRLLDDRCSDFFALRLPEAYLNRAEALAMLGRDQLAAADLLAIRKNRIPEPAAISETGESLVNLIRDERRREFVFEGQRWFDLRRYAVSPKWPFEKEIRHPYYEYSTITGDLVLKPYSQEPEYYVLPLPENEVQLNGGALVQNPVRALKTVE